MKPPRCPFEDEVLVAGDGVLDPVRRIVVEAHLGVCPSCAALEETLDAAARTIRAAPVEDLGAVDAALARVTSPAPWTAGRLAAGTLLAVGAAAAVWLVRPRTPEPAPPTRPVAETRTVAAPEAPAVATPTQPPAAPVEPTLADRPPEGPPPLDVVAWTPPALADLPDVVASLDLDDSAAVTAVARRVRVAGTAGSCAIAALLASDDAGLARRALAVAAEAPSSQHVGALARLLDDPDLGPLAARQLGSLGTQASAEALAQALGGPSRAAALDALAESRSARAFDLLAARARSGADARVDDVLHVAVTRAPDRAARLLVELATARPDEIRDDARSVLAARFPEIREFLVALTRHGDATVAAGAVAALGRAGDDRVVEALRAAAARPALVRAAVASLLDVGTRAAHAAAFDAVCDPRAPRGLATLFDGHDDAADVLVAALSDERPQRRLAAAEALGHTRSAAAVPALAAALDDPPLRPTVIDALGAIGGDEAATALADEARDRTTDVRLVRALGATESALAVAPLRTLAREPALAAAAAEALGNIPAEESVLALADLLAEPRTARAAAASLATLPAGVVVPALLRQMDADGGAGRAHRALVVVAGADLGRAPGAWRTWWSRRSAAIRSTGTSQEDAR